MAARRPFWKWHKWKSIGMHIKFEIEIPKQTRVMLRKLCQLQSPDAEKSNMATRPPFWEWHCWKSIGFFPYTQLMCQWSLGLIVKAKLKFLKVTSLKINRLLPKATNNMHMKFEIEILQQTWVTLRKPCRLQTDGQTDRRTRWFQYTLHHQLHWAGV